MDLSTGQIHFATIPNNGSQTIYPDGVMTSIVEVDRAAIPDFIKQLDGKGPTLAGVVAVAPRAVTVDVLNGTDIPRLAAGNATALRRFGFKIDVIDSANATAATTIEYPASAAAKAKALLAYVPKAKTVETSTVTRVTLLLGTNGVQVKGLGGTSPTPDTSSSAPKKKDPTKGLGCID
jgi:hypothetical protein